MRTRLSIMGKESSISLKELIKKIKKELSERPARYKIILNTFTLEGDEILKEYWNIEDIPVLENKVRYFSKDVYLGLFENDIKEDPYLRREYYIEYEN